MLLERSTTTAPAPGWLRYTAWGAFLVTVPSALWRVLMITGLMPGTAELRAFELGDNHTFAYGYVFGLSVVQLGFGFLTVGLARRWGVVFRGRRVPRLPVVVAAVLGGLAVTWLFDISMLSAIAQGRRPDAGHAHGIALGVMVACYAPILLWGPLVLASAAGYWQRTRPQ